MLRLSHIQNIRVKLSSIDSLDELESHDKQLYELIENHYTFFVGADVSQNEFSIDIKKANCETIYEDKFSNHHTGFCKLYETFNNLNAEKEFKFQVAIESTGPHHKAVVRFLQEKGVEVFVYNPQTAKHLAKASLLEKKTDKSDAEILALLLINGKFPTSQTDLENEFIEIRSFSKRGSAPLSPPKE